MAATIPMDVWLGRAPSDSDARRTRETIFQYFDLCNEQIFLREIGRVSEDRWAAWEDGIRHNLRNPTIAQVWSEVAAEAPDYFSKLERLLIDRGKCDPRVWRARPGRREGG